MVIAYFVVAFLFCVLFAWLGGRFRASVFHELNLGVTLCMGLFWPLTLVLLLVGSILLWTYEQGTGGR